MEKKLIVITGASSGIGKATAIAFSKEDYPLLLLARRIDIIKKLNLPNTICAEVNVSDYDSFESALKIAEARFGPTDCIINNAGVMFLENFYEQEPDEWKKMFDTNVIGMLNGIKLVLKGMIVRETGTIVNVGSTAGKRTFLYHAAYCGTKFAVHALTESIREEVADRNIRLVCIAPGVTETELLKNTKSKDIISDYNEWKISIGGGLDPKYIADAILYAYKLPQNICAREIIIAPTQQAT